MHCPAGSVVKHLLGKEEMPGSIPGWGSQERRSSTDIFALVAQLVQSAPLVKGRSSVRLRPGARTIHDAVGERSTIRLQSGAFGLCRFDSGQRLVNTMPHGVTGSTSDSESGSPGPNPGEAAGPVRYISPAFSEGEPDGRAGWC